MLKIESNTFADGDVIPRRHGYKNGNERPALTVSGIPTGSKSLAIVVDDPDAVAAVGKNWIHWIVWNIEPRDMEIGSSLSMGCVEGTNDFGYVGYGGPAPPDREHTYVFTLYALDVSLDLEHGATRQQLDFAMRDHIVETSTLRGRDAPQ